MTGAREDSNDEGHLIGHNDGVHFHLAGMGIMSKGTDKCRVQEIGSEPPS